MGVDNLYSRLSYRAGMLEEYIRQQRCDDRSIYKLQFVQLLRDTFVEYTFQKCVLDNRFRNLNRDLIETQRAYENIQTTLEQLEFDLNSLRALAIFKHTTLPDICESTIRSFLSD